MVSLLEGGIANIVYGAAKFLFLDATLIRETEASTNDFDTVTTTVVTYPCKAIEDTVSVMEMQGGDFMQTNYVKVLILAASLATEPKPLDRIVLRGKTLTILPGEKVLYPTVQTDPAHALWTCRCG